MYTEDCYREGVFSQNAGAATQFAFPLVYSANARQAVVFGSINVAPTAANFQGGYAAPEIRRQVVYAVDGHVSYYPSTWALGNEFRWGWRIIIAKMEPFLGAAILDTAYSMWVSTNVNNHIAQWRNTSNVLAEGRWYKAFGDASSAGGFQAFPRWRSSRGRALANDEGLFLFLEGYSGSPNSARNTVHARTLMRAPA